MLSAVEGLQVAAPPLAGFVLPIAAVILTALFLVQRWGTGRVGSLFGPVMISGSRCSRSPASEASCVTRR